MGQTPIHTATRKQNYWAIVCPDSRVKGGLWKKWMAENCVAIGWPPHRYHMNGPTKDGGWKLARKRVQQIAPGDIVIPYLRDYTFGVPGEVVKVAVGDAEWEPTVTSGDDMRYPDEATLGRRIQVKWLENEVPPFEKVAVVPKGMRERGVVIRPAISPLKSERLALIMRLIRTPINWKLYKQVQASKGNNHLTPNSKVSLSLLEDSVSQHAEERIEQNAGFQSNPKIRRLVELQAMSLVEIKFRQMGYAVLNRSSGNPYDLLCRHNNDVKYVEVKGTQTDGASIVLTNGEVKFVESNRLSCTICVVHGITVSVGTNPKASGGTIRLYECSGLDLAKLFPISYTLKLAV